jgi:glycosyltransferase involved in cell wall biosynthesis
MSTVYQLNKKSDLLSYKIAVIIPCHNEEITISKVVTEFKQNIPFADIFVFDNASSDKTSEKAIAAGASVILSPEKGKGNVVRHMFEAIDADYYIMVDGDDTYPASESVRLLKLAVENNVDMLVGTRVKNFSKNSFRRFHEFGNKLVAGMISNLFGYKVTDVLSGYRIFSKNFVRTVPLKSKKFEIETELTLQTVSKGYSLLETPISYGERPAGSYSKLNTYRDGVLIIKAIVMILKDFRPLFFFSAIGFILAIASIFFGAFPIYEYLKYKYVYHVPLAILASGIGILAVLFFGIGLILDTVNRHYSENFLLMKRLLNDNRFASEKKFKAN